MVVDLIADLGNTRESLRSITCPYSTCPKVECLLSWDIAVPAAVRAVVVTLPSACPTVYGIWKSVCILDNSRLRKGVTLKDSGVEWENSWLTYNKDLENFHSSHAYLEEERKNKKN